MLKSHRTMTLVVAALVGLTLGLSGCKKKSAKEGGAKGDPSAASKDAMGDEDPGQPPTRPVEQGGEAMDPEAMAPPDMDPDAADRAAVDPNVPVAGQATARMILIPWKDAENVVEELKRTKTEAKTLAESVLTEAKAKPSEAGFTALVRKHSAGPTKESGGKVGPFGPKDVPAYIAKAVFALPKGGISAIVETPSGYHIFMRTE